MPRASRIDDERLHRARCELDVGAGLHPAEDVVLEAGKVTPSVQVGAEKFPL